MNLNEFLALNGDREIVDIEALEKCLEPKKPEPVHGIKYGGTYYFFDYTGNISSTEWTEHPLDYARLRMGNVFLTLKEIAVRKKMLLIEAELIKLGGRREFKAGQNNFYITYGCSGEDCATASTFVVQNDIYFDTQEEAHNAIAQIGKQRFIDEYFKSRIIEVKENG